MPRKKYPKPQPLERYYIPRGDGIASLIIDELEIWNNLADTGERGSWRQRNASTALDILIGVYEVRLLNPYHPPTVSDIALKRLLGKRQTSKLVLEIKPILRKHKLSFQKTALWLLAQELQKTFVVIKNGIQNNSNNPTHISINSPEYQIQQKILKGTF
jgi:hypothetical protein